MSQGSGWYEEYAYPGEIERLAPLAREFIPPWRDSCEDDEDDEDAIEEAICWLIDGLEKVFGKEHELTKLSWEAFHYPDSVVELWRQVEALSKCDLWKIIEAVRLHHDWQDPPPGRGQWEKAK